MRITYFHYLHGEDTAHHHVQQFVRAARELGHELSVHAMNLAPAGNGVGAGRRTRDWVKARFSRYLHEPKELLWNPRYVLRELAIVRAERPDVILARDHHLTMPEVALKPLSRVPLVLEVNSPACESTKYFTEYAHVPGAGFLTERLKLRSADKIIVVSEALRQYLVTTHRLPPDKTTVNHNGADCERFHPAIDGSEVRRQYRFGDDLVVGFVGSLHPWHGPDLLKVVIDSLCRPGVRFLLVGAGPGWAEFREWLTQRPYAERASIVGSVSHVAVPAYVAAMDVAFVPESNFYGSSLKTLEYMAAGRAIAAPRYGPFEEIIDHGEHGLLFPPRDVGAAVDTIERLLADAGLRHRLGANARRRVTAGFTWRDNAERVLAACRDVTTPLSRRAALAES